jgi:hypothetical protein
LKKYENYEKEANTRKQDDLRELASKKIHAARILLSFGKILMPMTTSPCSTPNVK